MSRVTRRLTTKHQGFAFLESRAVCIRSDQCRQMIDLGDERIVEWKSNVFVSGDLWWYWLAKTKAIVDCENIKVDQPVICNRTCQWNVEPWDVSRRGDDEKMSVSPMIIVSFNLSKRLKRYASIWFINQGCNPRRPFGLMFYKSSWSSLRFKTKPILVRVISRVMLDRFCHTAAAFVGSRCSFSSAVTRAFRIMPIYRCWFIRSHSAFNATALSRNRI